MGSPHRNWTQTRLPRSSEAAPVGFWGRPRWRSSMWSHGNPPKNRSLKCPPEVLPSWGRVPTCWSWPGRNSVWLLELDSGQSTRSITSSTGSSPMEKFSTCIPRMVSTLRRSTRDAKGLAKTSGLLVRMLVPLRSSSPASSHMICKHHVLPSCYMLCTYCQIYATNAKLSAFIL